MACRDQDGNLISADSTGMLNDHKLEIIPVEKVSQLSFHFSILNALVNYQR